MMKSKDGKDLNSQFFVDGYFLEKDTFNSGFRLATNVKEILYHKESKYQDVIVFDSGNNGKALVLDGALQCSEFDEFAYNEMIALLPVNSHPSPSNVLVIGGGDGGVVRELDKHPNVQKIILCELDEDVLKVCNDFLPSISKHFCSPKAEIIVRDAFNYICETKDKFDVIICDLTDPDGPSEKLYTPNSIELMYNALTDDGILCLQSESFWISLPFISNLMKMCNNLFHVCRYASIYTALYPLGQIGLLLASKNKKTVFENPLFEMNPDSFDLKYYSPQIHSSSFVLPAFAEKVLHPK